MPPCHGGGRRFKSDPGRHYSLKSCCISSCLDGGGTGNEKIFSVVVLAVTIIFVSGYDNQAEAYEYYVGTSKDGYAFYLMTETVGGNRSNFSCRVRAANRTNVIYISYSFWYNYGWYFSNSQGIQKAVSYSTPIAQNILNFVLNNY